MDDDLHVDIIQEASENIQDIGRQIGLQGSSTDDIDVLCDALEHHIEALRTCNRVQKQRNAN